MEAFLKTPYYVLTNPSGFSSIKKLVQCARYVPASYGDIKKWLLKQDTYALSKPSRRTFPMSSIYVAGIDAQLSMDLIDFVNIASSYDDYRYILVVKDIFSRYVWTVALKRKMPAEVVEGLKAMFQQGVRHPKYSIYMDGGKEFNGKTV